MLREIAMKDSKNIIKKIVLDIDGKEISLTSEQAKRLCHALMDMLGIKEGETKYVPYRVYPYDCWDPCVWPYTTHTVNYADNTSAGNQLTDFTGAGICYATYNSTGATVKIKL